VAKTYEREGAWDKREFYLTKALPFSQHQGTLLYQIAIAQWQQKKLAAAIQTMNAAINASDLNPQEKQNAKFYLAGFHADAGELTQAREILFNMLREDPLFEPAKVFLQRLRPASQ